MKGVGAVYLPRVDKRMFQVQYDGPVNCSKRFDAVNAVDWCAVLSSST